MYTREVNGKELNLGVSGKLYKDALVMFDRQTGTLWTQVDGAALRGPLAGNRLTPVPALQTTWKAWKELHPTTLVLQKPASVQGSPYEDYFGDSERRGLFGTRGDKRLPGKTMIVGIAEGTDALAIPLSIFEKLPLVEFKLNGKRLLAYYDESMQTVAVFRAASGGRELSFRLLRKEREALLQDVETGSAWSALKGHATAGPLKGAQLEPVSYLRSYWFAWSAYRPGTRIFSGH